MIKYIYRILAKNPSDKYQGMVMLGQKVELFLVWEGSKVMMVISIKKGIT